MERKGMKRQAENDITFNGKKQKKEIEEGELGIIESVSVQNFMCHENLSLNFGPHVNFIIGQNGSGKSAILTAIILALGGKSSTTDRFKNLKGFVKNGKNKAKIEVVLRNRGMVSYKPETYGDKIIVIREFSKDGTSTYKIKSESGTICSNQKSVLSEILDAMDIMVDCPVCVLTQANSKKFLISKEARGERLYEFFYKGAGLEALENTYKSTINLKESAKADLDTKIQLIPDLKKELKKWKRFLDSSRRISDYQNELIWANVIEMERQVKEKEEEHMKIVKGLEEHRIILEDIKKSHSEKSLKLDELINKEKKELETEMEKCRKKLEYLKSEYESFSSSLRQKKGFLQKLENDKKKLEDDILGTEKCINEQKMKNQKNMEDANKKRQEALQKLKDKNTDLGNKLKNLKETINTSRSEQNNLDTQLENIRGLINQRKYEIQKIDENMIALKNAIKNQVNAFGDQTERVLYDIENNKKLFKKQPFGPIGMFLEMKNPKWAPAAEFAIGSPLLNSFCVDNHQDAKLLKDILRRIYQKPPSIIVSRYESTLFDVESGKVQSNFPTVLDMLIIKNHIVANCLIDQAAIEKKILVEDENAVGFLINNRPTNCLSAYFMNCDQICYNPSRFYSFGKMKPRSRLSGISTEDIRNLQREKEEKQADITQLERQWKAMRIALTSVPEKIEGLEHKVMQISAEYRKNLSEMKELENREEPKDVSCMQEELQALQEQHTLNLREWKIATVDVSELTAARLGFKNQIDDESDSLKSFNNTYERLLAKISEVSKHKEGFETGKKKYESELKTKENEHKSHLNRLQDLRSQLDIQRAAATKNCPRINTDRSTEEISNLIKETQRVVETQSNCDRMELEKKYKEKLQTLQNAEYDRIKIEKTLHKIGEMLERRFKNLNRIRMNTELLTGLTFTTILSGNGYTGDLIFNQVNRTLKLNVSPRASDRAQKNHSSLSGGERSFVTIAFLLALWGRTKMPFRILDEYDVFMDSNNRQLSVDLLCRKAIEMATTQFVFLSPLDQPRLPSDISKYVETLKMAAPKRKNEDRQNSPRKKCS